MGASPSSVSSRCIRLSSDLSGQPGTLIFNPRYMFDLIVLFGFRFLIFLLMDRKEVSILIRIQLTGQHGEQLTQLVKNLVHVVALQPESIGNLLNGEALDKV